MMTNFKYITAIGMLLFLVAGCRKYVEIEQPGKRSLKYTADYAALLNDTYQINSSYYFPWIASDDLNVTDLSVEGNIYGTNVMLYTWAGDIVGDADDDNWLRFYRQVYLFNEIISGVMSSERGTEQEKKLVLAQAKMNRAYSYLDLVNMYAKHYDKATAATDPGVPLLLQPEFSQSLKRVSVQQVYDQITTDLLEAIPDLPDLPGRVTQASKAGAFGILAREQLYMGEYTEAARYASSALALKNTLLNLGENAAGRPFPVKLAHPEILFDKTVTGSYMPFYPLSSELQALFLPNDLRWVLYTVNGMDNPYPPQFIGRSAIKDKITNEGVYVGPGVPEMLLIKAEAFARAGQTDAAMNEINILRAKRFSGGMYPPLTPANADEALVMVLEERRRELFATGLRWFDQKRLNKESAFAKTVTRQFRGATYTLQPNSDRYVFPIAKKYILLNPEIEPNK